MQSITVISGLLFCAFVFTGTAAGGPTCSRRTAILHLDDAQKAQLLGQALFVYISWPSEVRVELLRLADSLKQRSRGLPDDEVIRQAKPDVLSFADRHSNEVAQFAGVTVPGWDGSALDLINCLRID